MVRNVLVALVAVVGLFVAVVLMQSGELRVERSAHVAAPPDVVFDQLDDFVAWQRWNPWQDLDPGQKTELGGPESGVGAWYTWEGNDDVGKGRMEILSATAPERVVWDLRFESPWEAHNTTAISVEPDGEGSSVTWTMTGDLDFMGKAMGLIMDMDAMVGPDFERGLQRLDEVARAEVERRAAEAAAAAAAAEAEAAAALPEADAVDAPDDGAAPATP